MLNKPTPSGAGATIKVLTAMVVFLLIGALMVVQSEIRDNKCEIKAIKDSPGNPAMVAEIKGIKDSLADIKLQVRDQARDIKTLLRRGTQ